MGLFWRVRIRQFEFQSTVEADAVCAVFDGEHAALVTMPATEDELENPK
jgi:hypothetical protein